MLDATVDRALEQEPSRVLGIGPVHPTSLAGIWSQAPIAEYLRFETQYQGRRPSFYDGVVPGFDITTLTEFNPPLSRCPRCLALWTEDRRNMYPASFRCGTCAAEFWPPSLPGTDKGGDYALQARLWASARSPELAINLGDDVLAHATALARIATELRGATNTLPPLNSLIRLFRAARSFIHITTFGMDEFSLGLLETVAQTVNVNVAVAGLDKRMDEPLSYVPSEAPALEIRIDGHRHDPGDQNHGKLTVIDGLLAINGSANLTNKAWRKAAVNMEIVDLVADLERVRELNNRYFSHTWARLGPAETRVQLPGRWHMLTPADPEHPSSEVPPPAANR